MSAPSSLADIAALPPKRLGHVVAYVHQVQHTTLKDKPHIILWVGDPSVAYFKLHAWASEAPLVTKLVAGDIAAFRNLRAKCFRGVVEGHLTRSSSVVVLMRNNQFLDPHRAESPSFCTLLPLLDWTRQLEASGRSFGHVNIPEIAIKDLRENMLAHVVCQLRPCPPPAPHSYAMMYSGPEDGMLLHLWNDPLSFRSLRYNAPVRVTHLLISFDASRQCLVATTTGESRVEYLADAPETASPTSMTSAVEFDGFNDAMDAALNGHVIVRRVGIRHVILPFAWDEGAWQLIEKYCVHCETTLPEAPLNVHPRLYSSCVHECDGSARDVWRYKPFVLELVDVHGVSAHVHAHDVAIERLLGHIPASLLAAPTPDGSLEYRLIVEALLRSLTDTSHPIDVHVYCSVVGQGAIFALVGIPS
ncbi:hypothetical protein SPRG_01644 [Saprolegnia parasitica CBS 223.65]|uniref:Uncharacterized protein n=1 Tax=Saprolegnia parasitica (strain CBS 223.65) TaxID=695850 RepID=A0A067CTE6_SAPPC|nr:hypothetical protein SPRG_01644 [Saprolegnia parasitica CBS 223.65]KDO33763.1 hypothetical protein SPRG_01644 [Saprolegnia parasitica CBS 223.65]|eukprot:XP_012195401.1 hypothetical protein SPRG_01644 [Saprolegnia parasitica CBS 223.65]